MVKKKKNEYIGIYFFIIWFLGVKGNDVEWNQEKTEERSTFIPLTLPKNSLFETTKKPDAATISTKNFTFTVETYEMNPYIRISKIVNTPTYREHVTIIDLKNIEIDLHNSLKFIDMHSAVIRYNEHLGFKTIDSSSNKSTDTLEFYMHDTKLDFDHCLLTCSIMKANLPINKEEIEKASDIFGLKDPVWINTTTTAEIRGDWSWKHIYDYKVQWNNITLFPHDAVLNNTQCYFYKKGSIIEHDKVGYVYTHYHSGDWYNHAPRNMHVAMADQECSIFVAEDDRTLLQHHDENFCMCVRPQSEQVMLQNKLEANEIYQRINLMHETELIEDWRYATIDSNTRLELINNTFQPRFVRINESRLSQLKDKFLIASDLTNIDIDNITPKNLKVKDLYSSIFQGLVKTMVSNPQLLEHFHSYAEDYMSTQPDTKLVSAFQLLENSANLAQELNEHFPEFYFNIDHKKISIIPAHTPSINWDIISSEISDQKAILGIKTATKALLNADIVHSIIIPQIINKHFIPISTKTVDTNRLAIIKIQKHASYMVLRTYLPVLLPETTTVYQLLSLPHSYNQDTGKFVVKQVPPTTIHHDPGSLINITSRCEREIIRNDGHLDNCPDFETNYDDIRLLTKVNEFEFYYISNIGETSFSCPGNTMKWYHFVKDVNIIMKHSSCFMQSVTNTLQIVPTTSNIPKDRAILFLLSYDLNETWIPRTDNRFILQIILIIVVSIILLTTVATIIFVLWKKPWMSFIPQNFFNRSLELEMDMNLNKVNQMPDDDQEFLEDRNYQQDLLDYQSKDEKLQEEVESHYATVQEKRKIKATLKNPKLPMNNVHWKFDNEPLKAANKPNIPDTDESIKK